MSTNIVIQYENQDEPALLPDVVSQNTYSIGEIPFREYECEDGTVLDANVTKVTQIVEVSDDVMDALTESLEGGPL